jgi:predicted TIM-barrel fold metal-dependent hydrolase
MTSTDAPVIVVSADTHVGPRLREDLRGYCPARLLDEFDLFADENDPSQLLALIGGHPNTQTAGHHDSDARLRDYDRDGVAAGVLFHNSLNGQTMPFLPMLAGPSGSDLDLRAEGLEIYNRWLIDFVAHAPDRHVGLAQLPMWDIAAASAALERAADGGLQAVNFPAMQEGLIPEYNDRAWDPFWSMCAERSMPLVTHVGGGSNARYSGPETMALIAMETGGWIARRAIWWLIFGGVFERHPSLKLVITETPGYWWADTAGELDSIYDMVGVKGRERFPAFSEQVPRRPSEYMATNVYFGASFAAPFEVAAAVEAGTDTHLMWGSDYPHPEGTFVYQEGGDLESVTRLSMRNTFCDVPPDATRRMLGENAVEVFRLDRSALLGVAARIGAPTLAELATPINRIPVGASAQAFRTGIWT